MSSCIGAHAPASLRKYLLRGRPPAPWLHTLLQRPCRFQETAYTCLATRVGLKRAGCAPQEATRRSMERCFASSKPAHRHLELIGSGAGACKINALVWRCPALFKSIQYGGGGDL